MLIRTILCEARINCGKLQQAYSETTNKSWTLLASRDWPVIAKASNFETVLSVDAQRRP